MVADRTAEFIFSRICLLISPMLLFAGLMSRHDGFLAKFSLFSFSVMNDCFFAIVSILSPTPRSEAMLLSSWLMWTFVLFCNSW